MDASISQPAPKIGLFPRRYELLCLLTPLLMPIFAVCELGLRYRGLSFTPRYQGLGTYIASTVGLNGLHVYLTFSMLLCLPEFKEWARERSKGEVWTLWARALFILFATVLGILSFFWVFSGRYSYFVPSMALVVLMLTYHHNVAQQFGLSLAYGMKAMRELGLSEEEIRKANRSLTWEKRGRLAFMAAYLASRITIPWDPRFFPDLVFFPRRMIGEIWWVHQRLNIVVAILAVLLILNSLRFPKIFRTNKPAFMMRLLMLGVPYLGPLTILSLEFTHGIEYLGVYRTAVDRSRATALDKRKLFWLTAGFFAVAAFLLACRPSTNLVGAFLNRPFSGVPGIIKILSALSFGIAMMHYYFDALIYRMRDPRSRRWIAPLLS